MRLLLVAMCLMGGANSAWGDETVVYGRAMTDDAENGYTAWSAADVATSGSDLNIWYGNFAYNETYGLYQSASGGRSAVMTFSHTNNSLQVFDIVFNNLGNTGNTGNYSYIKIGSDIEIQSNQQNQTGTVIINGNSSYITDCNQKNYNRGGDLWTIHVEINTAQNKVTALTIVGEEKNSKYAHYTLASETALSNSATYNTVSIGFIRAAGTPSTALTSIRIAEEAQAVTNADYTINYLFEEELIKTEEGTSTVGAVVNAVLPFTKDGRKYYAADAATTSIELIDGTNILNVNLRKANEYAYTVQNNFGTNIASGNYIEGEDAIKVYWSKYVENGGTWYECDEASYGVSITGTLDKTVNYTTPAGISYFIECENLNVSRSPAASDTGTGYSGGKTVRHYSSSYWWTPALSGGIYSLSIPYKNANSTSGTIYLYLRDSEGNLTETGLSVEGTKQSSGTLSAEGIAVPPGYSLVLNNTTAYNSNVLMDYIALTKTAEYTIPVTVGANGYTTFASPYALDLTDANRQEGLKAYKATLDGTTLSFTALNQKVPAGTGLLLQGETKGGSYNIAVVASGDAIDGNALTGVTEATGMQSDAEGNYIFVMKKATLASDALTFLPLTTASTVTIPAGKAYISVPATAFAETSSRDLSVSFDDETTSISEELRVNSEATTCRDAGLMAHGSWFTVQA